jgi:ribonuclease E
VLKSGGYIVINQTEALVSIDVNSGKATREHNIEDTALKTNLEAAEEIARQLRLRDLAGLIVIDFIDMDERRNSRLVERRLKESLRNDRARIQVGRISHFGLLEMSRQRLRTGMLEGSTKPCPMCQGVGIVRSVESVALDILRSIEDRLITDGVVPLVATTAVDVALYILNQKRAHLNDIQQRYRIPITVTADEDMHVSQFVIERAAEGGIANGGAAVVHMDWAHHHEAPAATGAPASTPASAEVTETEGEQGHRRSRRRRRRGGRHHEGGADQPRRTHAPEPREREEAEEEPLGDAMAEEPRSPEPAAEAGGQTRKGPRRRGRRGGRRGKPGQRPPSAQGEAEAPREVRGEPHGREAPGGDAGEIGLEGEARQNGSGRPGHKRGDEAPQREIPERPHREPERVFETVATRREQSTPSKDAPDESRGEPDSPPRRGWWRR